MPKSSPDGDFRLSFSCAETMLLKTLFPLQHKVLIAFKTLFKKNKNVWNATGERIISSYHLKTIAFWYFEKTPVKLWTEEFIVHHLLTLIEELENALRDQNLPMYFMPKVNLFGKIDDPQVAIDLMGKIAQLSSNFSAMCEALYIRTSIFDNRYMYSKE